MDCLACALTLRLATRANAVNVATLKTAAPSCNIVEPSPKPSSPFKQAFRFLIPAPMRARHFFSRLSTSLGSCEYMGQEIAAGAYADLPSPDAPWSVGCVLRFRVHTVYIST